MKKRIIAFLLAAVTAVSLIGCGKTGNAGDDGKAGICYDLTGIHAGETIVTVDGVELPMDLYFYWLNYNCSYLDNFMQYYGRELDWDAPVTDDKTAADYVKEETLDTLKLFAVTEKLAADNGIELTEEQTAALEEQRAAYIEQFGSEESYEEEIGRIGLRVETYDRICRNDYLYEQLSALYADPASKLYPGDEALLARAEEQGYITTDHLLLTTKDAVSGEDLDSETVAQKRALAEQLLEEIRASEDPAAKLAELADQYGEDPGREAEPNGYTFCEGTMVEEFDTAARALEIGGVSDIVESDFGFHIIVRKPLDEEAAKSEVGDSVFSDEIDRLVQEAKTEPSAALDTLDIAAIYEGFKAAQQPAEADAAEPAETAEPAEDTAEKAPTAD